MINSLVMVAAGGALGASARYLLGLAILRQLGHSPIPLGVMMANIIGSFLMGVFVVAAAHRGLAHLSPLVMTGVLGGFTTFSAFSLETATLIERGETANAMAYAALSVLCSIGGLFAGLYLARGLWT